MLPETLKSVHQCNQYPMPIKGIATKKGMKNIEVRVIVLYIYAFPLSALKFNIHYLHN